MKKITDTVVRCRFEATNLECDDVVLMKIIRVLYACLSCPAGGLLSDDSVFEMLSICYRQSRGRLPGNISFFSSSINKSLKKIYFLNLGSNFGKNRIIKENSGKNND